MMPVKRTLFLFFIIFCFSFFSLSLQAQTKTSLYPIGQSGCNYLEDPVYIINPGYVIYQQCTKRKVFHPDMASFKTFRWGNYFALDKNGVYFEGEFIATDTTGFEIFYVSSNETHHLWKTRDKVFDNQAEIEGADAPSFNMVSFANRPYYKDKNSVYYWNKKMPEADVKTIVCTNNGNTYDKNWIYRADTIMTYRGKRLHSVNQILGKTDNEIIYLSSQVVVKNIDFESLHGLSPNYSVDKNHIYCDTTALEGAHYDLSKIKTWEQVNSVFLSDGHTVYDYYFSLPSEIDAASFNMLPHSDLFFDKNAIYSKTWDQKLNKVQVIKYPFNYTVPVTSKNTFCNLGYFLFYNGQVYDLSKNKMIDNLTPQEVENMKMLPPRYFWTNLQKEIINGSAKDIDNGVFVIGSKVFYKGIEQKGFNGRYLSFLNRQYYRYKDQIYHLGEDKFILMPGADAKTFRILDNLVYDKNHVYYQFAPLIKSDGIEWLTTFAGPRYPCNYDAMCIINYNLYHNTEGYWIKINDNSKVKFIGKTIDPKLIQLPKGFELTQQGKK